MINKSDKIYIAGHRGMVGSACWRAQIQLSNGIETAYKWYKTKSTHE